MKKIFLSMAACSLALLSSYAFADKIIISGEPVVIEKSGDYYSFPTNSATTYSPRSDYYYVSVDGTQRVCYRETQPALAGVNLMDMSLKIGSDTVAVHCYTYSPEYFTTQ